MAQGMSPSKAEAPAAPGSLSLSDMLTVLLHKSVADSHAEVSRASHSTGKVIVSMEVYLYQGKPRWHNASVHFSEHQEYGKETIVGTYTRD